MLNILELENKPLAELRLMASRDFNIPNVNRMKKEVLCVRLRQAEAALEGLEMRGGILETMNEGIGFLRSEHYQIGEDDVYVSQAQIRRYGLRDGDFVIGNVRPPRDSERHYGLLNVETVNGMEAEQSRHRPKFENLTPIIPEKRLRRMRCCCARRHGGTKCAVAGRGIPSYGRRHRPRDDQA